MLHDERPSRLRLMVVADDGQQTAGDAVDALDIVRVSQRTIEAFRTLDLRVRQLRKRFVETPEGPARRAVATALMSIWRDYGVSLAELLRPPARRALADGLRSRAASVVEIVTHDDPLCLQLAGLPWESLWLEDLGNAIGLHPTTAIIRTLHAGSVEPPYALAASPLTITMAIFGPYGPDHVDDLDTDAEWEAVASATMGAERPIRLTEVDANDFGLSMLFETDVLHLSSHGAAGSILVGQWHGPPRLFTSMEFVGVLERSVIEAASSCQPAPAHR